MPRKPWVALPHEANLFHEVYIDESSWNAHHYCVIGGLIMPLKYSAAFAQTIIEARGSDLPITNSKGKPRVIKWEKASAYSLAAYKRVIDAFFLFPRSHNLRTWELVDVHCTAIDLTTIEYRDFSENDENIGYEKEIYFLCTGRIARRHSKELFHIYPDRRETIKARGTPEQALRRMQNIMNFSLAKKGDKREWPIRRFDFRDPEDTQALQVVDILIGAVAYRLNGHYDKPLANPAKKELSDYILKKALIAVPTRNTRHTGRFTLFHHKHSPFKR